MVIILYFNFISIGNGLKCRRFWCHFRKRLWGPINWVYFLINFHSGIISANIVTPGLHIPLEATMTVLHCVPKTFFF